MPLGGAKDPSLELTSILPKLVVHAKAYILAERYLSGLKSLALQKFTTSVCDCFDADYFLHAMQEVYTSILENGKGGTS